MERSVCVRVCVRESVCVYVHVTLGQIKSK